MWNWCLAAHTSTAAPILTTITANSESRRKTNRKLTRAQWQITWKSYRAVIHLNFIFFSHFNLSNFLIPDSLFVLLDADLKISSQLFCRAFPFHVLFDRNLVIKQVGDSLSRIQPKSLTTDCKITDILHMVRTVHYNSALLPIFIFYWYDDVILERERLDDTVSAIWRLSHGPSLCNTFRFVSRRIAAERSAFYCLFFFL